MPDRGKWGNLRGNQMSYLKTFLMVLTLLLVGCSITTSADEERKFFEKLNITDPRSKNFAKGLAALHASCSQTDSTSIQTCQFYTEQTRALADPNQFVATAFYKQETLSGTERTTFNNITLIGAAYREYVEAKQSQTANEHFWNSAAAGAAFGALFSRPTPPPSCHVYNAHTPSLFCQ